MTSKPPRGNPGVPRPLTRSIRTYTRLPPPIMAAVKSYAADQSLYGSGAIRQLVEIALRHLGRLP